MTGPNDQIYDAIRKAGAAGDGESVKKLAAYLDQQQAAPDAPTAAPVADNTQMYSTIGPNKKTVMFRGPADATDEEIRKLAVKATGSRAYLGSIVKADGATVQGDTSALHGLALGAVKPIDFIARQLDKIPGVESVDRALSPDGRSATEQHQDYVDATKNNTRTGYQTLGNIAGVAPLALVPGANTSLVGMAATGAAGGAVLSDSDTAGGIAADAALGAGAGLVGGKVVAPALGALARGVGRYAVQPVANAAKSLVAPAVEGTTTAAPSSKSVPILLKTLAAQGQTPAEAVDAVTAARARGVPLALMDTGDETRGLASALSRSPGESRTTIRGAVLPRQDAQLDRVQGAIADNLGPVVNVRQQSESLMQGAKTAAGPLYDQAYAAAPVSSPRLEKLLRTPAGQAAISRARTIAANEERDPRALGFELDGDGNVKLNPVPVAQISDASAARAELDAAQEALRASRTGPGDPAKARARVEAAREAVRSTTSDLAQAPTTGVAATGPVYSPQTLDYVKRGLDDVVEQFRDKTTGRLVLDEAGRAINGVRHNFVSEVDNLNPAYKAARDAYAGPARMTTALQKGATISNKDAETVAAETANLSPSELEQYKLGVRSALSNMLEGRVDGSDKVKALVGSPKKRAVLENLFGGQEKFGRFMDTLGDEGQAAATYGRVNTGSMTAANLADDGNMEGLSGIAVKAGARLISGHGIVGNALATLQDLYRYGAGEAGARVKAELAKTISTMDPNELAAFQQAAEQLQQARLGDLARTGAIRRVTAPAATAGVSRLRQ